MEMLKLNYLGQKNPRMNLDLPEGGSERTEEAGRRRGQFRYVKTLVASKRLRGRERRKEYS